MLRVEGRGILPTDEMLCWLDMRVTDYCTWWKHVSDDRKFMIYFSECDRLVAMMFVFQYGYDGS